MRRLFTLCIFSMALLLGTSNSFSQDKRTNAAADAELANLVKEAKTMAAEIGLNEDQLNAFTRAYVAREQSIKTQQNSSLQQTEKRNMSDKKFIAQMRETLSGEQLEKFKAIYKKKMQRHKS
ncbi:MAG: hypothetical protein HKO72_09725 [Flavobacteriaceae bacterium]|nr:hypothetical protein [Bacteroidia bacterium]NNL61595.1 hypothetical protein [Flavobacteriaceae bacterium]